MDIEEYISSGVLELYATGALTAAEKAEVERIAAQNPAVRDELSLIQNTLDRYAEMHAVIPPAALKDKVLQAVFQQEPNPASGTGNLTATKTEPQARIIPMGQAANQAAAGTAFKWLIAASVTLLLVSNAFSYYFYRNWKESDQNLQLALNSQQQYARNYQQVQQKLLVNQQALVLMKDANTLRVELKGVEKSPDALVTVFWHRLTKNVYLNVENLPAAPSDKQYQLWALVDGKPIDAGLVTGTDITTNLHHMKDVQKAQAFAITLEPKGGSVNPTMAEMYVMGKI